MIIGFVGLNYLSNLHEHLKYATYSFPLRYLEDRWHPLKLSSTPNQGHYEHKILSHSVPRQIKDSVLSALHKTVLKEKRNV